MATISLRSTKNVIYKAYQELLGEHGQLKTRLKTTEQSLSKIQAEHQRTVAKLKSADGRAMSKPKTITVEKIVEKVAGVDNVEGVIEVLNSVQEGIGKAISQCSNMQVVEAETLGALQAQIAERTKALKELYDIDIQLGNGTLDGLFETYEKEQKTFHEDMKNKREQFSEAHTERQRTWEKEKETQQTAIQDRKTEDRKLQVREQEEYQYTLKLERANEDDAYAQKKKKLQTELDEIEETQREALAEKEKAMAEKEAEFEDYKQKYEALPDKLSKAIKKAEAEGAAVIERDAKVKEALLKKEIEANQKANEMKINSLQQLIRQQDAQIQKLSKQLENALKQTQDLAIKAIEGAANTDSFNAIRAIAMEQAKHITKSK